MEEDFSEYCINSAYFMYFSFASYMFIFEAHYYPPSFNKFYSTPTKDNSYFIINDTCGYDLYINDTYIETIIDIKFYSTGIKIYNKKGEIIDETE